MSASIAAGAALLSALLTFAGTYWLARVERRRREFRDAVNAVLAGFVGFREEVFMKIEDRRAGVADTRETRKARYAARSAFTTAVDQLHTAGADQALLEAVEDARRLVIALGKAAPALGQVDDVKVAELGDRCRKAHTALRDAARRALQH